MKRPNSRLSLLVPEDEDDEVLHSNHDEHNDGDAVVDSGGNGHRVDDNAAPSYSSTSTSLVFAGKVPSHIPYVACTTVQNW